MRYSRTALRRFWSRIDMVSPSQCWNWRGGTRTGYGRSAVDGRLTESHRLAYELLVGPIPDGLQIDHLCRNRACCNPLHLEPVTQRENVLRSEALSAKNARKTHCPRGHAFTDENTYVDRDGWRRCRKCKAEQAREYEKRRPARVAS
jgi:hypothetical protein